MELISIIVIAVILAIQYFIALEFEKVVKEKGYQDSRKYMWICFLLSIYGYLLVIALPDRKKNAQMGSTQIVDDLPDL